jgi:hypothetical protein
MPQTSLLPGAGSTSVAAGQTTNRYNLAIDDARFGLRLATFDIRRRLTNTYVSGLPRIFVSVLQYPEYDRGDFTFVARNYIAWRVVGTTGGANQPGYPLFASEDFLPLTTPQLLVVGQPVNFSLLAGGLESVSVEFDTTSGTPAADQGVDRIIVTISASQ